MAKFRVGDLVTVQGLLIGRVTAIEQDAPVVTYSVEINDETGLIRNLPESALELFEPPPLSSTNSA